MALEQVVRSAQGGSGAANTILSSEREEIVQFRAKVLLPIPNFNRFAFKSYRRHAIHCMINVNLITPITNELKLGCMPLIGLEWEAIEISCWQQKFCLGLYLFLTINITT